MSLRNKRIFIEGLWDHCNFPDFLQYWRLVLLMCLAAIASQNSFIACSAAVTFLCRRKDLSSCLQARFLSDTCSHSACFCVEEQFGLKACWLNWHLPQAVILLSLSLSASQFISYIFMSLWHPLPTFSASFVLRLTQPGLHLHLSVQGCSRNSFFSD